ncbi:MAG: hypothetical protein EAX96_10635 [Candidatus Lokiarchaeota archaeon]|nr:hypothetical protein [Candidatus Lokiarchaeota archaeon]
MKKLRFKLFTIVFLLVMSFSPFIPLLAYFNPLVNLNTTNFNQDQNNDEIPNEEIIDRDDQEDSILSSKDASQTEYNGIGSSLQVDETAQTTNRTIDTFSDGFLGISGSVFNDIPPDWSCTQIYSVIDATSDSVEWIAGFGDTSSPDTGLGWTQFVSEPPANENSDDDSTGANILTYGTNGFEMELHSITAVLGTVSTYVEVGDYGTFTKSYAIPRGEVYDAKISLDFLIRTEDSDSLTYLPMGNLRIYVEIEGTVVWYKYLYEFTNNAWDSVTDFTIPTSVFSSPTGTVDVEIGFECIAEFYQSVSGLFTTATKKEWLVSFDNFELELQAGVHPDDINLQMATNGGTAVSVTPGSGYSDATVINTGLWNTDVTSTYTHTNTNTSYLRSNTTAYINQTHGTKDILNEEGVDFSVSSGGNVSWEFYNPSPSLAPKYTNRAFNITFPGDWTINEVLDPNRDPISYNIYTSGNDKILEINSSSYTSSGYWYISANSSNYITNTQLSGNSEPNNFRPSDTLIVNNTIRSLPDSSYSGYNRIEIYDPDNQLFYGNETTVSGQYMIFNIPLSTAKAGTYTIISTYNDSLSPKEAGFSKTTFMVNHSTLINSTYNKNKTFILGNDVSLGIFFDDLDAGFGKVADANVTFVIHDWTGIGNDLIIDPSDPEMISGGGNYLISIPTTISNLGAHTIDVYADKEYYDTQTNLSAFTILILEEMFLSFSTVPVTPYSDNTTLIITAQNSTGPLRNVDDILINGTLVPLDFTETATPGEYELTINTSDTNLFPAGQYLLIISFNKTYHLNKTLNVPLTIRDITSDFIYTPPGNIRWSDTKNATIYLNYRDADHELQGIPNANIQMTATANESTYPELANGVALNIYPGVTDGEYIVNINMSTLDEGKYIFNFSASAPSYNTRYLSNVIMNIVPTETKIECPEYPAALIPQGPYNITLEYWDLSIVEKIVNTTDNPVNISISWDNSSIDSEYTLIEDPMKDTWYISIDTTGYDLNIKYNATITINKTHYEHQEIKITISLQKNLASMGVIPPERTVWGENVSFYVSYTDISGIQPDGSSITLNWSSSLWSYTETTIESIPYFNVTLNVTDLNLGVPTSGRWGLQINCSAPNYNDRTQNVYLYVRPIDTQIFYQSPPVEEYGDNSTFYIQFIDTYHNNQPISSDNVSISVNIDDSYYNTSRIGDRYYISINTTYWGSAGSYPIIIYANWTGIDPLNQYQNNSVNIIFTVRNGSTEILYEPPGQIAWGHNITELKIQFHDTDTDTYPNITAPDTVVYVNETPFTDITYEAATESYILNDVDTDDWELGVNYLNITIVKEHYDPAERLIKIIIRPHNTEILYTPPGQIPWGTNATLIFKFHDIDDDTYPEMEMNSTTVLISNVTFESAVRKPDGSYIIYNLNTDSFNLGSYYFNITVNNNSHKYHTAIAYPPLTIRNVSTFLQYDPPGITPYSATENATFTITYEDEFSEGIDAATINLNLKYIDGGSPGSMLFIYNENWTYSYLGNGEYSIQVAMENLSTNLIYTFQVNASKANYIARTLSSVNLTLRDTYTRLRSPQAPSAILPEGLYNITIYYEDREAGVGISNETAESYHVSMNWSWDHTSMQENSTFIQLGTGTSTYWVIQINTTSFVNEFGADQVYNLTINASKQYYEWQELNIAIKISLNMPILGVLPPEGTVWGENVTFNITYTTLGGEYIEDASIDLNWTDGYYTITDFGAAGNGKYEIEINTTGLPIPNPEKGYYVVQINVTQTSYDEVSQTFNLRVRPIDTQILYEAPEITPIGENVSFAITYIDTFHDLIIYDPSNVTIQINIPSTYYSWTGNAGNQNYDLTIDTDYWSSAGTYPITISMNWTGTDPVNKYQNKTLTLNLNVRNRIAELSYEPIGSVAWGRNTSLTIQYRDLDLVTYPNITSPDTIVYVNETPYTNITYITSTQSYILNEIDTDDWELGLNYLNVTIVKDNYSTVKRLINVNIRAHDTELTYTPPGQIPWGTNATLAITFRDIDFNSYPEMNLNDTSVLLLNFTYSHAIRQPDGTYIIYDINMSTLPLGNYKINVTIFNSSHRYDTATVYVPITVRNVSTFLEYDPPGTIKYSSTTNATFTITYKDEFDQGVQDATVNLSLIYMGGNPPTQSFILNQNWTYTYISGGTYQIGIAMENISTNIIYTFSINVNKSNYVSRTISSVNLTVRDAYTRLTSPQAPSAILQEGMFDILIYYEDREASIGISNESSETYHVSMNWSWDHTSMQANSTFLQMGSGSSTYWVIRINTTGFVNEFGTNQLYNLTLNASKQYYEWQELQIQIRISLNVPILAFLPPGPTVWGENVTFSVYYATTDGNYIPNANFTLNWPEAYYFVEDFGTVIYNVTINTSGRPVPILTGFYQLFVNISQISYEDVYQSFNLRIRPIDTQILYEVPEITPISENVSFSVTYKDTYHDLNIYDTDNVSINVNISSSYYNWIGNPGNENYDVTIDTDYWDSPGTYAIEISIEWIGTDPSNKYQNSTIIIGVNVRNRIAELNYEPIGSIPWGKNISLTIQYHDLDLNTYPTINETDTIIYVNESIFTNVTFIPATQSWILNDIDSDSWTVGKKYINLTIVKENYSSTVRMITANIRDHTTELLYTPPDSIPWGHNLTSLTVQFRDTDNDTYPDITSGTTVYVNDAIFTDITPEMDSYRLNNIDTEDLLVGTHSLNITIVKTGFDTAEAIITITIRIHTTEILYTPPGQIPWGTNENLTLQFHDIDDNNYPEMALNDTNVLILEILGETITYDYAVRQGNEYIIYNVSMETRALGNYQINLTIYNQSEWFKTAMTIIPITVRNISTFLQYDPPGVTPYSATENVTFNILYTDEFGGGIDSATVSMSLIYIDGGSPGAMNFAYNENWTYSEPSAGIYRIQIAMENLSTNVIYTFRIDVNKSNYVSRTLSSVNLTLRDTYTRLRSPQSPSAILQEGMFDILIYYEDREASVGISNETGEIYHVSMNWSWDHASIQANSTFLQMGSGTSTYWVIRINTTGFIENFGADQIYNLTLNASKQYYEWQELFISIKITLNQPLLGFLPPESTVWGENVTFNVTYTTLDGNYIPGASITLNWTNGYYYVQDLYPSDNGTYQITLNTTGLPVPDPSIGYHLVEVHAYQISFGTTIQTFYLRVRPIDTQILYEAPDITAISKNVTFSVVYRDIFHSVDVYVPENMSIQINIPSSYYSWTPNPIDQDFDLTIDTDYWSAAGTYSITITMNWTGSDPVNKYQNNSLILNINIRNRIAELSYEPIGSIPWGNNASLSFTYFDLDLESYPILTSNNVTIRMNGSILDFGEFSGPLTNKYTIKNINVYQNLTIGLYILNLTIQLTNYSVATRNISFTIRAHASELEYDPIGNVAWNENTSLRIYFRDVDNNSYPNLDLSSDLSLNVSYSSIIFYGNDNYGYYELADVKLDDLPIGTHYLELTISNSSYSLRTKLIHLTIRARYTSITINTPAGIVAYGNFATISLLWTDNDIESTQNGFNATYGQFNISLMYQGQNWLENFSQPGSNQLNTTAWWEYGTTIGSYIIHINTSCLAGIDSYSFTILANHSSGYYDNCSTSTYIQTRYRNTYLTVDSFQSPVYGENLTLYARFYDMDNVSGELDIEEEISGATLSFVQSGLSASYNALSPYYTIVINTSEFITINKDKVHNLNLTISWPSGIKFFYVNQSINVSIICKMIDTYHHTYFNTTATESYSGWNWGTDLNISIDYYYYFYGSQRNISGSYIDVEAPAPYTDLWTYLTLWGLRSDGQWENITLTKYSETGLFRIELNASAPENDLPYIFNVTIYNSTNSDDMFRNQSFQFAITFKKPFTGISIICEPDVYIPWGTNMTLKVFYFVADTVTGVSDSYADLMITIIGIDGNTTNVDVDQIQLTVNRELDDGRWNITMNTTWTENYTWLPGAIPRVYFRIDATALYVTDAWQETSVFIREIRSRLDFINGTSVVYTDRYEEGMISFNATYRYIDVDSGLPIEDYGTTTGRYANITFWNWDTISGLYNDTMWGQEKGWNETDYFGNFTVIYLSGGYYLFNFTFHYDMATNGPYQMKIAVNGTHLRGPTIDKSISLNLDYWVTLRLRSHRSNITFDDRDIMPQVPEWNTAWTPINTSAANLVVYGEELNISLFWYDLDLTGPLNQTGISFGAYNLTATIDPIWGNTEVHLLGSYTMNNMYIVKNNATYKGLYVINFDTGFFLQNYEFYDLVNGGPLGDGTYNLTVRFWLTGEAYDPEYQLAIANITIKILPIKTQINVISYSMGGFPLTITNNGSIVPFGTTNPDSLFYLTEFNFTNKNTSTLISSTGVFSSMVFVYFENYTAGIPDGTLIEWTPIFFDKGTGQYKVRIFTDTEWILNDVWIPWNATGYKEVNITIRIAKPNYENASAVMLIAFRKHDTRIAYFDSFGVGVPETPYNNESIGYRHERTIYFKYIDLDAAITGSEEYIRFGSVTSNWTFDWGRVEEVTTDRGWYRMIIDANPNFNVGTYYFNINASDSLAFRANTSITWEAIIIKAFTDLNMTLDKPEVYQFIDNIVVRVHYEDQFGQVITDATISYVLYSNGGIVASGVLINAGDGNYYAQIPTLTTGIGLFNISINATPSSVNFEGKSKWTNVVVTSIFLHPISVVLEIIVAGIIGFISYRQVKWIITPYTVKQIIKTRKVVSKKKDIKEIQVVRDRKELFKEEFAEEWAQLSLKPPTMVSSEIIQFTSELSNIKRSRVTTSEAKSLVNELKAMTLEQADAHLEKVLMIPPEARRRLLKAGGIIEVQKPEVIKMMELLVQIKEKPYTYEYCDELYSKLIKMKPEEASDLLWNQLLISSTDRITILQAIGMPVGKLRKKMKKELEPLSEKDIKKELKRYAELTVEQKQRELERILKMAPKQQRKYLGDLKKKQLAKEERKRKEKEEAEAGKGLTEEDIDMALKEITSLSDSDKKMMKESLMLLPPEEREATLEMMKNQFASTKLQEEIKPTGDLEKKDEEKVNDQKSEDRGGDK